MQEINNVQLIDFLCPDDITATEGDHKKMLLKERAKWSRLIEKKQNQTFYLSLNLPVLFLGLFLWSGIFGGLWFAYRGRLWFGTFIWPILSIATSLVTIFLLYFILGLFVPLTISSPQVWLTSPIIIGRIIAQFPLSFVANYFYLNWADKKIKQPAPLNYRQHITLKVLFSFVILFIMGELLMTVKWQMLPPALFFF